MPEDIRPSPRRGEPAPRSPATPSPPCAGGSTPTRCVSFLELRGPGAAGLGSSTRRSCATGWPRPRSGPRNPVHRRVDAVRRPGPAERPGAAQRPRGGGPHRPAGRGGGRPLGARGPAAGRRGAGAGRVGVRPSGSPRPSWPPGRSTSRPGGTWPSWWTAAQAEAEALIGPSPRTGPGADRAGAGDAAGGCWPTWPSAAGP